MAWIEACEIPSPVIGTEIHMQHPRFSTPSLLFPSFLPVRGRGPYRPMPIMGAQAVLPVDTAKPYMCALYHDIWVPELALVGWGGIVSSFLFSAFFGRGCSLLSSAGHLHPLVLPHYIEKCQPSWVRAPDTQHYIYTRPVEPTPSFPPSIPQLPGQFLHLSPWPNLRSSFWEKSSCKSLKPPLRPYLGRACR
jgi:hypothetical protein